jgi:hypothetical protein
MHEGPHRFKTNFSASLIIYGSPENQLFGIPAFKLECCLTIFGLSVPGHWIAPDPCWTNATRCKIHAWPNPSAAAKYAGQTASACSLHLQLASLSKYHRPILAFNYLPPFSPDAFILLLDLVTLQSALRSSFPAKSLP